MTDLAHWATWREIHAQPDIWDAFGPVIAAQREDLRAWIKDCGATEVWFSGAGTSAYIGDFVAAALGAKSDLPLRAVASTDLVSAPHQFLGARRPLVVNFGRSGDSTESIGVLNVLDNLAPDVPRLNITCNGQSALAQPAGQHQRVIVLPAATHDAGFAMTSSYSTMLLAALCLFDPAPPKDAFTTVAKALQVALPKFLQIANEIETPTRMVITGSGALRYAAREAALKIMELTAGQIPVLWDSSLGFRHGPKSFVTPGTHVICLRSSDPAIAAYDADLVDELKSQFSDITVTELAPPPIDDTWGAVVQVAASQVIAAVLSHRMGLNVDDPFAGQGTLTRVVSGVTLYPPAVPS